MKTGLKTPILFFIFNRPKETALSFAEIKCVRPIKLFIVADGPRSEEESHLCEQTRAVVENIDWACEVVRKYSNTNRGCGRHIASSIDWVFSKVDEAIIIEDDCIPDQTFFQFCEEMLNKYRNNLHIMSIAGISLQEKNTKFDFQESYYFSIIAHGTAWATWKRAWNTYDFDMKLWPAFKKTGELSPWFANQGAYERFSRVWDQYFRHEIIGWDSQWSFACIMNHGLCINPSVNLITNIGQNERGTNFKGNNFLGNQPRYTMIFPMTEPTEIKPNRVADDYKYRMVYGIDNKFIYRILRPFKNKFPKKYAYIKKILGR